MEIFQFVYNLLHIFLDISNQYFLFIFFSDFFEFFLINLFIFILDHAILYESNFFTVFLSYFEIFVIFQKKYSIF